MNNSFKDQVKSSLWLGMFKYNATFILWVALAPVLAITQNLDQAIYLGLIVTLILIVTSLIMSMIKTQQQGLLYQVATLTLIAALVTISEMILQIDQPAIYRGLGIYLPLSTISIYIIFHRAHQKDTTLISNVLSKGASGLGFLMALIIVSIIRSILSSGAIKLFGIQMRLFDVAYSFNSMETAFGSLLVVGLIIGFVNSYVNRGQVK